MERSSEYRKRAEKAKARANESTDPQLKQSWNQCAASWRMMAEQAERLERERRERP